MKILYFSQFYKPESIAASFRATDNAENWVKDGNSVTVFTAFPNYPTGRVFYGYRVRLLAKQTIEGVKVLRSKLIIKPNTSMFNRLENALSFFLFGLYNICFNCKKIGKEYDVVLGSSGTIFAALLGWAYSAIYSKPFVFEIRDITYKQMIATGKKESNITVIGMKFLELFLAKRAKKVVVVTNGFKNILINDGIKADKIHVITNGVDVNIAKQKNEPKLVLSYYGTLGISQNIVDTFAYSDVIKSKIINFEYLIIGEGAQKSLIRAEIQNNQENYINLMDGMSSDELEQYYCLTKLSVVTIKKSDSFKDTIPSKIFQIMGRGIAVLFIGPEGEAAEIIRKYNAGIVLTGTVKSDLAVLEEFFSKGDWKAVLEQMGKNGAEAVAKYYSRKTLAYEYLDILKSATEKE